MECMVCQTVDSGNQASRRAAKQAILGHNIVSQNYAACRMNLCSILDPLTGSICTAYYIMFKHDV